MAGSTKNLSEVLRKYGSQEILSDNGNILSNKTGRNIQSHHLVDRKEIITRIEDPHETLTEEFGDNNQTRYNDDESELAWCISPVPILPIKVPQHLRHLYDKKSDNNTSNKKVGKRPNEELQPDAEKKSRHTYNSDNPLDEPGNHIERQFNLDNKKIITLTKEDTEEALIEEFFTDNQTRYQDDKSDTETFIGVVPILPIKVPQHLRHLYAVDNSNDTSLKPENNKTNDEIRPAVEKPLFHHDVPGLDLGINNDSTPLVEKQESKAKLSMLQSTQNLKEHQWNNPTLVAEYSGEIFGHLYDIEPKYMADPSYALIPDHTVTWKLRGVLVDWIVELHSILCLLPETLFLAVNIMDRFLSLRSVALDRFQLVGIASLLIATKFEEMIFPNMYTLLQMADSVFTDEELVKAERFILHTLDFELCYPNPVNFLRRICTEELKCDIHTHALAHYFMEVSCVDHVFISTRPSKIAAASLWLAKKMLAKGKWTARFSNLAGYTPEDLKPTVQAMLSFLAQPIKHEGFFNKWASSRLFSASYFVRDWVNRYYVDD